MKLLRRKVRVLEAGAAAGRDTSRPVALVWTSDNERIEPGTQLEPGEHIATDVYVIEEAGAMPARYKLVERITDLAHDHGVVRREHGGAIIGRVRESRAPYLDIEWYPESGR